MLHVGRCGSTVVANLLDAHPSIHWDREIFEPWRRARLDIPEGTTAADVIRLRYEVTPLLYGFETKYLQAHHVGALGITTQDYLELLADLGFKRFVTLHRRNYLRRVVSGAVARQTGEWHRTSSEASGPTPISLDPSSVPFGSNKPLLDVFAELERGEDLLARLLPSDETIRLWYEDDIADNPRIAYSKITRLFGVDPVEMQPNLFRSNPFPLADLLTNLEEITTLLNGTRYEWMLSDE